MKYISDRKIEQIKELTCQFSDRKIAYLTGSSTATVWRIKTGKYLQEPKKELYCPAKIVNNYKTKMVYELVKGDIFRPFGAFVEYIREVNGRIIFAYLSEEHRGRLKDNISANSKQIVEVR